MIAVWTKEVITKLTVTLEAIKQELSEQVVKAEERHELKLKAVYEQSLIDLKMGELDGYLCSEPDTCPICAALIAEAHESESI